MIPAAQHSAMQIKRIRRLSRVRLGTVIVFRLTRKEELPLNKTDQVSGIAYSDYAAIRSKDDDL